MRVDEDGLRQRHRRRKLPGMQVADGRSRDLMVPHPAQGVVKEHAHEAVVPVDRPSVSGGEAGQHDPRQRKPAFQQPLILTLALEPGAQLAFERLRSAHFPPARNLIPAHVTLFHQLPGAENAAVQQTLSTLCQRQLGFPVRVAGLRPLGRGVAFALESAELARLRGRLAVIWADWLAPQDRQGYRPHVTVQNKADPAEARALLQRLQTGFAPYGVQAEGLLLWRYHGGPWEAVARFPFQP